MINNKLTHGSLFSGIGGFDLASEWMGWENKFHCEWNGFGQKVLNYYWPEAELFTDITKSNFTKYANKIDVLTGGFPCQPYSTAGKRLGKEDDRHLWPEMLRAIREIQPMYVVGENVRGLTNWNGGMVFDEVQADLEAEGYEVLPFLLPACAVNAPHRRDRIWFVAKNTNENGWRSEQRKEESSLGQFGNISAGDNERIQANYDKIGNASDTNSNGLNECDGNNEINASEGRLNALCDINQGNGNRNVANTMYEGLQRGSKINKWEKYDNNRTTNGIIIGTNSTNNISSSERHFINFPSVAPICNGDDGLSDRLDNITFSKLRNESIKAGGNAIVPQVAYQIFKAIEEYERITDTTPNN